MRATLSFLAACYLAPVLGDVYMQYPPGSNNRLDEGGGNRNNNNRLMDTQNNAKGGYGYGGSADNKAAPVSYMAGSKLSVTWTSQHSCGSENSECQIVVQYMCNDQPTTAQGMVAPTDTGGGGNGPGEGPLRDGTNNNAPDPNNPNAARGLMESTTSYQRCENRERMKSLYTSDQNLNGNDATKTRQNPNGARSGLECPEERDYYPYWAPSHWKDLMVMTNNLALCDFYQQSSQNVAPRGYCTGANGNQQPNNQQGCTQNSGTWHVVPPFGIAAPECVAAPVQRDNHLGNTNTGQEAMANITIPYGATGLGNDAATNCAIRLRYNITTADTRACSIPIQTTKATCEAAGGIWSAMYVTNAMNDNTLNSNPPLPDGNPTVGQDLGLSAGGGTDSLLELAVNTNQYGRTFQDRTHSFSVQPRPASVPSNLNIYNLNVKGKRGNIVQTYPATEYDFHPTTLVVGSSDAVHIQWTGNDNTNNNGNNNGEGVNNEDRHNIVQLDSTGLNVPAPASQASMFDVMWEWNNEPPGTTFGGPRTQTGLVKQFALTKQQNCAANPNNDQQRTNCEKLNNAAATVDFGLLRSKPGAYRYMSSRNNNFSNRAQKAKLIVDTTLSAPAPEPTHVEVVPVANPDNPEQASAQVYWLPPGEGVPITGTDDKVYYGKSQEAVEVNGVYAVEYSCDGGFVWTLANQCQSTAQGADGRYSCRVDLLPAGTPCAFRVRSGNGGGWGTPSQLAVAQTIDSDTSLECREQIINELNGNALSTGGIVAIVIIVLLIGVIIGGVTWYFKCGGKSKMGGSPPPPPPGGKFATAPPPPPQAGAY